MAMPSDRILDVRVPERIVRAEPGPRKLYVVLDHADQMVVVLRHYRDGETVPCDCPNACPTARNDWFIRAVQLHHIDADQRRWWEPVVLHLTDDALRRLETQMQTAGVMNGLAGTMFRLGREGSSRNSRIVVTEVSKVAKLPATQTSVRDVLVQRRIAGFIPLFADHQAAAVLKSSGSPLVGDDQVIAPARSRNDKPRVPKGTRG